MKDASAKKPPVFLFVALVCALFGALCLSSAALADDNVSGQTPAATPGDGGNAAPGTPPAPGSTETPTPGENTESGKSPSSKDSSGQTRKQRKPRRTSRKRSQRKRSSDEPALTRRRGLAVDSDGGSVADSPLGSVGALGDGPVGVPNLVLKQFQIPPFLLPIYQAAGTQYGIRWEVLAAINEIETDYGRNLSVSSAGALGWMQFMPATWEMYGVDANNDGVKDPYNPVDAIFAAARYLKAAGGHGDLERAIFAYNHAQWYVDQVMLRAKLIAGVPDVVIDSLTGLTQGHFPVWARASYTGAVSTKAKRVSNGNAAPLVEGSTRRNGIRIYSREGAPAIAVQDAKVVALGKNRRDGNFIVLEDGYGNHYKYGNLGSLAKLYPVPRGDGSGSDEQEEAEKRAVADPNRQVGPRVATKQRVYAHPERSRSTDSDGYLAGSRPMGPGDSFGSYFARSYGLKKDEVVLKNMKVGAHLISGTIVGRLGARRDGRAPYIFFQVRPAGSGAPVIDPKPILDGWKLLDSTAVYRAMGLKPLAAKSDDRTIGQILLMSKEELERYVLSKRSIEIYPGGRRDIAAGQIDRRVLSVIAFLDSEGYRPNITSLISGHGILTSSGNVSEHSTGDALDIASVNGKSMIENNGPGGLMEEVVRKIMTLQGVLEPHQIISMFDIGGATSAMSDHNDHIHVGFRSRGGVKPSGKLGGQRISKKTWYRLFDHIGKIKNPNVPTRPSAYAVKANENAKNPARD